jgi:hypothetical protein
MKIKRENDEIVIRIPAWSKRHNPYTENEDIGEFNTLIGIIEKDASGNDECGFAYVIDMDYKGKSDQWTEVIIKWYGEVEDFKKLCRELKVGYVDQMLVDLERERK